MNIDRDISNVALEFRWSPNAFRGFGVAIGTLSVIVLVSMCTSVEAPEPYKVPGTTGVTLIRWGDGDGTGGDKGNLSKEGKAVRGQDIQDPLSDAQKASNTPNTNNSQDPNLSTNYKPVNDVGGQDRSDDPNANAGENRGSRDGDPSGTGIGMAGSGPGKGLGLGDIDWGGGGNRTVTNKVMPTFPPGTRNTQVKLRFRVRPDGTVSFVMPVRRGGDPAADAAAARALRRWTFNKLNTGEEMEGTITFVFKGS